eukprot:scaffold7335_cov417-Prasinococcus_capsulatus_cf.AAC.2
MPRETRDAAQSLAISTRKSDMATPILTAYHTLPTAQQLHHSRRFHFLFRVIAAARASTLANLLDG